MADCQKTAYAAVEQAFNLHTQAQTAMLKNKWEKKNTTRLRKKQEIDALAELLYQAVCEKPGEGIAALADYVGKSVNELTCPARRLKQNGKIRSIGLRNLTRYFPM